ncbi:MAG TPA: hypothetical protein VGQ13_04660 [Nitrososphaera sp.]|nr:hypothetical protein [Nitrososphaera sp.]
MSICRAHKVKIADTVLWRIMIQILVLELAKKLTYCKFLLTARTDPLVMDKSPMGQVYEIHKYRSESFLYVVARTNKHAEDYVRSDVEKMNDILSPGMRAEGIRYVFALGTVDSMSKKAGDRLRKKEKQSVLDEGAAAN